MTEIIVLQMPVFKRAYKKLYSKQKIDVNKAIKAITNNPEAGEEKKAILRGFMFISLTALISNTY